MSKQNGLLLHATECRLLFGIPNSRNTLLFHGEIHDKEYYDTVLLIGHDY